MKAALFILLIFSNLAFSDEIDPLSQREKYRIKLQKLLDAKDKNQELGNFYENLIGDFDSAAKHYQSISDKKNSERILYLKNKFHDQDQTLNIIKSDMAKDISNRDLYDRYNQLEDLIKNYPDYYRRFEVFYTLGIVYMIMDKYKSSYESFQKSLELKPACHLFLPIISHLESSHQKWIRHIIISVTYIILFVLALITFVLLYYAKPWLFLKHKHITLGLLIIFLWVIVFYIGFYYFGKKIEFLEKENTKNSIQIYATPFTHGSGIASILFIYGLFGVIWTYLFSASAAIINSSPLKIIINYLFAWLIFTALLTHFYMLYCDGKCEFETYSKNILYYYKGSLSFNLKNIW
ncbi:MAG: hypothetical protein HQK79_13115 [Desulfobacterales bacterium]|nr:hypothetical protein [Desulfobacterales bacterium]MBF0397084.1 hypothetical protein [Desulfobacterales bacterium]